MFKRTIYAVFQAWAKRDCLRPFLSSSHQSAQILSVKPFTLKKLGIAVLVLDFDGVLAPHGTVGMLPEVEAWIEQFKLPIYILSNKPFLERMHYLKVRFPEIKCVQSTRKKPYPDGLLSIIEETKCAPNSVLMIDDRLLTGILAACLAGCQGLLIQAPFQNYKQHPFIELFFATLRKIEQVVVKALCRL